MKKKKLKQGMRIGLPLMLLLGMTPVQSIKANDKPSPFDAFITFDCGSEATSCPSNIYSSYPYELGQHSTYEAMTIPEFSKLIENADTDLSVMPIAERPGYRFVGWHPETPNLLFSYTTTTLGELKNPKQGGNVSLSLTAVWEEARFDQDSTVPVNITRAATPVNVTLPSTIDLLFNGSDIQAQVADHFMITNNSAIGNLVVTNLSAKLKDSSWSFKSETAKDYYTSLPLNSKELYLGFSKDGVAYSAISGSRFDPGMILEPGKSQNFKLEAKTGGSSITTNTDLTSLEFTFAYERSYIPPELTSEEATALGYKFETMKDGNIRLTDMPIDLETVILPRSIDGKAVTNLHFEYAGGAYQGPQTPILNETMKTLVIPATITNLDDREPIDKRTGPFAHAQVLETVIFEDGFYTENLPSGIFQDCPKLKNIDLSAIDLNSLKTIGNSAFEGCSSLSSEFHIPESVTTIGRKAFANCTSLDDLIIPGSITSIGIDAFLNVKHIQTTRGTEEGAPWGAKSMN